MVSLHFTTIDAIMVLQLLDKYYRNNPKAREILMTHSEFVAEKALLIASKQNDPTINLQFIEEASLLHDIGILHTKAEDLFCFGELPYIAHGYKGREILEKEGYPKHALVCERHTGAGLSLNEIRDQNLPIPHREMLPISIEEEIICFADKFYSKSGDLKTEKSIEKIRRSLAKHNEASKTRFDNWCERFL